jgi:hypothetical protein
VRIGQRLDKLALGLEAAPRLVRRLAEKVLGLLLLLLMKSELVGGCQLI